MRFYRNIRGGHFVDHSRTHFLLCWVFFAIFSWPRASECQIAKSGGVLYFELIRYESSADYLANGKRCELFGGMCDPYFKICVGLDTSDSSNGCEIISGKTSVFSNRRTVSNSDIADRIKLKNPWTKEYTDHVPTTIQVRVIVREHDDVGKNQDIGTFADQLKISPFPNASKIAPLNTQPVELKRQGWNRKSVIRMWVKVYAVCNRHVFGEFCEKVCFATPKYSCDSQGNRICRPGWTGEKCDQVDRCVIHPCANHANCVAAPGISKGRICVCNQGSAGPECYADFCDNNPCQHGGTCQPHTNTCLCVSPFYGIRCEHMRNACQLHPCKNNGTCFLHSDGRHFCRCLPGFEGETCEIATTTTAAAAIPTIAAVFSEDIPEVASIVEVGGSVRESSASHFFIMEEKWFWPSVILIALLLLIVLSVTGTIFIRGRIAKKLQAASNQQQMQIYRRSNYQQDPFNLYEVPILSHVYGEHSLHVSPTICPVSPPPSSTFFPMADVINNDIYEETTTYDLCQEPYMLRRETQFRSENGESGYVEAEDEVHSLGECDDGGMMEAESGKKGTVADLQGPSENLYETPSNEISPPPLPRR